MIEPDNKDTSQISKTGKLIDESMDKKQESFLNFNDGIGSKYTKMAYYRALDRFMGFSGIDSYDKMIKLSIEEIRSHVKNFIRHLKDLDLATNTVKLNLAGVMLFFDMNDVLLNKKKLYRMVKPNDEKIRKEKEKIAGKKPYTTEDIKQLLGATKKLRTKALILFYSSTGSRPAVLWDPHLRMKHLSEMPNGCKAVLQYAESNEEYYSFLTPEASSALELYHRERKNNGEIFDDETPLFTVRSGKPMNEYSVRGAMKNTVRLAGITKTKVNNKTDKAVFYGFRKRFNTILKKNNKVNSNIAEKLIGHKNGLDGVYLQPTKEECFEEFYKAVPELMIDQTHKQSLKIEELKTQNETLIEKTQKINDLESSIDKLKDTILGMIEGADQNTKNKLTQQLFELA